MAHYYLDEQSKVAIGRRVGQVGQKFIETPLEDPGPLPELGKADTAIAAMQLGTFSLQKLSPGALEDGTGTRDAYALCAINAGDLCALHRYVGEDSGGFWAALPLCSTGSAVVDTNVISCNGCADGTSAARWKVTFHSLTLATGVINWKFDPQAIAIRKHLVSGEEDGGFYMVNDSECTWSNTTSELGLLDGIGVVGEQLKAQFIFALTPTSFSLDINFTKAATAIQYNQTVISGLPINCEICGNYDVELQSGTPLFDDFTVQVCPAGAGEYQITQLAAAASTMAAYATVSNITGDAGGNTITTITHDTAVAGTEITLNFEDNLVTLTDDQTATADTIALVAPFTSQANAFITLQYDGTKWHETTRSKLIVNASLEIARGLVSGQSAISKFGRNLDVDTGAEDVWDQGGTWVPPTQARLHDIASTQASDDGSPEDVGAHTVQIWGLTSWSANEVTETITMNGIANVPTVNAYVIIHRMQVTTYGSGGPNAGVITATAQTDATVTAVIQIGEGQTQMAIYGVPDTQVAYCTNWYANVNKSGGSGSGGVDMTLLVNPIPDEELDGFVTKATMALLYAGNSHFTHEYNPYRAIPGPAIIKVQAIGSAVNNDVSTGFDIILVDN